ncbi:MAG: hypothetical protein E2P02_19925 [Acidobacteria bacterium]|nr:MAG: hypothetical protein E2P02_19925 [Acidobacteriota bacterium]
MKIFVFLFAFLFAVLASAGAEAQVTREAIETLERQLLDARPPVGPEEVREADGSFRTVALETLLPDGRAIPVLVQTPPQFEPTKRWPLLLAMHGGPMPDARSALSGALRMLSVWDVPAASAGVIVVSPAMTHVVARAPRTEHTLPYEILRPEQMEAILHDVAALYPIDPNRIVSTGISLGSNFSIGFAASRPDRFAAIVPVSTEGESREHLLRNLMHVPTFMLEGKLDRNIRGIQGPRAMERILLSFEYDIVYREMADRSHEGFAEQYPEVLRWLDERPRNPYPTEVVRVPHDGIMPLARRVHWIESDTRRGIVRARVTSHERIDIDARWVRSLRVFLTDHLVDLDAPIEIHINGERVYRDTVERSLELAAEDVRERGDPGRVYAASLLVHVPTSVASLAKARAFSESLEPSHPEGILSFWEMYAQRSIENRLPSLGLEGHIVPGDLGGELAALRVDAIEKAGIFDKAGLQEGDLLLEVDGEPFFNDSTVSELRAWLVRELDARPRKLALRVLRRGAELALDVTVSLEPF